MDDKQKAALDVIAALRKLEEVAMLWPEEVHQVNEMIQTAVRYLK